MATLTKMQFSVLEEIAYGFIYRQQSRHGYIKQAPEGGAWEKASIAVKSLILARPALLAVIAERRVYLTSAGWSAFIDDGSYVPRGEQLRLTTLADERVAFVLSMISEG